MLESRLEVQYSTFSCRGPRGFLSSGHLDYQPHSLSQARPGWCSLGFHFGQLFMPKYPQAMPLLVSSQTPDSQDEVCKRGEADTQSFTTCTQQLSDLWEI